jgi:EPS-associated MarR family transcriptional regulator
MYRRVNVQQEAIFSILNLLDKNPDRTQRELAREVGVSLGSINYCLTALINKGLVKLQNFSNSKNKFRYIYVLTPKGIAEKSSLTRSFLRRKQEEYEIIKSQISSLRYSEAE